jgi:DNA repair protein RadA/Sms
MKALSAIEISEQARFVSQIHEWDRVLGGGIMPGSFLIITGDPGIGKSTLLLQVAHALAQRYRVFYFSSEESLEQVKTRAQRLNCNESQLWFSDNAHLDTIIATAQAEKPDLIVIDSIQNCYASNIQTIPGSIGQLREAAFSLMRLAKEHNIAVIVTGHITKEGTIAGPKMLEHMVDGVFYLQGEDRWQTRVLRSVKNRFGAINELGFFQMAHEGMQEVPNINKEVLESTTPSPGSVLISCIEGSRPILIELQALTIASKFGIPQRVVTGIDQKQVVLVASILEKYLRIPINTHDIFFKVSGGFKVKDSACDLGIALALLSSYFQQALPEKTIALGEISLTGHIKPVNQVELHTKEAQQFGIAQFLLARKQKANNVQCKVTYFNTVYELLSLFPETFNP